MHNSDLLCSATLPHSYYRTPYLMPQLSYFIMRHLRFFFCILSSGIRLGEPEAQPRGGRGQPPPHGGHPPGGRRPQAEHPGGGRAGHAPPRHPRPGGSHHQATQVQGESTAIRYFFLSLGETYRTFFTEP